MQTTVLACFLSDFSKIASEVFYCSLCSVLPMLDEIGSKPEACARVRGLEKHIVKDLFDSKVLMKAPAEGYSAGVTILREHDEMKARKILKWMIKNERPHPQVENFLLGGNHSRHTNIMAMDHFKKIGDVQSASNFAKLRTTVLLWPDADTEEFDQGTCDKLYAVSLCIDTVLFSFTGDCSYSYNLVLRLVNSCF